MVSKLTSSIKKFTIYALIFLLNIHVIKSNDTASVSLFDMSIEELINQEVTIATKSSQKLSQTPSVVSVVTSEEISAYGYRDLEELLSSIPGIEKGQIFGGSTYIGVRGVNDIRQGGRHLVLLDGVPYNDIMYGSSFFYGTTFNMDAIERVEIIRGPGSALYGRNAFSSVINIITKKAKSNKLFQTGVSAGSFNTWDVNSSYQFKNDEFNSYISGKYYSTDGTNSTFDNGKGGKSPWNIMHDNLYLNANASYGNFNINGSYSDRTHGNNAPQYFMTEGNTNIKIGTYSLSYKKNFTSKIDLKFMLYGRNEYRVQNIETFSANTSAIHPVFGIPVNSIAPEGIHAKPVFDAYTYGGEIELTARLIKNNILLIGMQGDFHGVKNASVRANYNLGNNFPLYYLINDTIRQYYSKENMPLYEPGWIQDGGHSYQNAAIYFQDIHYLFENLGITLGGRLDFDSEIGTIFNPRLGMVLNINDKFSVKTLYGEAYRAPTTSEQYKIIGFDKGNENLKYEEIKTMELVFNSNFNHFFSQVSFYFNKLENLIQQNNINDSSLIKTYFNSGKNKSYGIEIENKYFVSKKINSFFNLSLNRSLDQDVLDNGSIEETNHPNVARVLYVAGFNYRIAKKILFSPFIRYQGPIEKYTSLNGNFISQDKVGDYYIINSSVILENIIEGLEIKIYGYNLLNTKYNYQDDVNIHQPKQPSISFLIRANYYFN